MAKRTRLETAQLVHHIGEEKATYMFKHVLVQELNAIQVER